MSIPGKKWVPKDLKKKFLILKAMINGKTRFNQIYSEVKGSRATLQLYLKALEQEGLIIRVKKSHKNVQYILQAKGEENMNDMKNNALIESLKQELERYKLIMEILDIQEQRRNDGADFETRIARAWEMIDLRKKFGQDVRQRELTMHKWLRLHEEIQAGGPTDLMERTTWLLDISRRQNKLREF